jgi:pyroglutamyl-peptidase
VSVLITAFGPWDGGSNASAAMLAELRQRHKRLEKAAGTAVALELLPVDTDKAPLLLLDLIRAVRPSHILLSGQAAGRNRVALERLAVNFRDFSVPDATGAKIQAQPVVQGGPEGYVSTWPDPEGAVAAIEAQGIPAHLSFHAGTHLCNQLLYTALHHASTTSARYAVAFLHLPLTPAQVIAREPAAERHPSCAHLAPERTAHAVEILLGRIASQPVAARARKKVPA